MDTEVQPMKRSRVCEEEGIRDLTDFLQSLVDQYFVGARVMDETSQRLSNNCRTACARAVDSMTSVIESLRCLRASVARSLSDSLKCRVKLLEEAWEEAGTEEKALCACARMCAAACEEGSPLFVPPLPHPPTLLRCSPYTALGTCGASFDSFQSGSVSELFTVVDGLSSGTVTVSGTGLHWYQPPGPRAHLHNIVTLSWPVHGLEVEDIIISITDSTGALVGRPLPPIDSDAGILYLPYTVDPCIECSVRITVSLPWLSILHSATVPRAASPAVAEESLKAIRKTLRLTKRRPRRDERASDSSSDGDEEEDEDESCLAPALPLSEPDVEEFMCAVMDGVSSGIVVDAFLSSIRPVCEKRERNRAALVQHGAISCIATILQGHAVTAGLLCRSCHALMVLLGGKEGRRGPAAEEFRCCSLQDILKKECERHPTRADVQDGVAAVLRTFGGKNL